MASIRFFKYNSEDLNKDKKKTYIDTLNNNSGGLNDRDWIVKEGSTRNDDQTQAIIFEILKREVKEVSTLDGLKEFTFVEEHPIIYFLEKGIVGFGNSTNRTTALMLKKYFESLLLKNPKNRPVELKSTYQLLGNLDEDISLSMKGVCSRNVLDIDRVSGSDRFDIRGKEIYEQACAGDITSKTCEKEYPDPVGKVKFCLRKDGLITIFKRNLNPESIAVVLEPLLKYLETPSRFQRNLSGF